MAAVPVWLIGVLVVVALYAAAVGALVAVGRRTDVAALARFAPDVVVLVRRLAADERVPRSTRWLLGALALYLVFPLDLVPDVVPVAGQLDDVILAGLVLRRVVRAAGPEVVAEHWPGPPRGLEVLRRLVGGP